MDGARFGEGGGWRWEETQQGKMQEMRLPWGEEENRKMKQNYKNDKVLSADLLQKPLVISIYWNAPKRPVSQFLLSCCRRCPRAAHVTPPAVSLFTTQPLKQTEEEERKRVRQRRHLCTVVGDVQETFVWVFGKGGTWPGDARGRLPAPFKCYIQFPPSGIFPSFSLFSLFFFTLLFFSPLKPLRKGTEYKDIEIYLQIHNGDGCGDVGYSNQISFGRLWYSVALVDLS